LPPSPLLLTSAQARNIWLHAQRLDAAEPFGVGPAATPAAIAHLGYLQIDTINVIERCHHHILHTRIPAYRREHLAQAQSIDKTVFEYWTHALAYMPTDAMPFYVRQMRRNWRSDAVWFGKVPRSDLSRVLARIRKNGPLSIRDIDDDVRQEKDHAWGSRKPSKRALEAAFYKGLVTVSARAGMVKTYELLTRHFGLERLPVGASDREVLAHRLDRALTSQSLVSVDSICHLESADRKASMRRLVDSRVRAKALIPVQVEGAGKAPHWIRPEALGSVQGATQERVHILSPFDPLVIQRKRLKLFFDYEHRFEAYVPKEKRVFGYFVCPVLVGDRIVAGLDLKTDRARGKLLVQKWNWVGKTKSREVRQQVEEALGRFEGFQLGR
jgi:uncharacterized protein YcaQ